MLPNLPMIQVNFYAILLCLIIAMPLGYLWYGPIFGRVWSKCMDMDYDDKPSNKQMMKSMGIYLFGSFLTIWVLAYTIPVWMPRSWLAGANSEMWVYAVNGAVWNWLGFMVPLQLARVAWEKRSWRLFSINTSFDLIRLFIFCFIISYWR